MKRLLTVALLLLASATAAMGQTQPPILDTPVQTNPQNFYVSAGGSNSNSVTATITGAAGQRVRLYSVKIWCGGSPGSSTVPAVQVTDGGALAINLPGRVVSNETFPVGDYRWLPGQSFTAGNTVVVTGNPGGGCTQGTEMNVQADQF